MDVCPESGKLDSPEYLIDISFKPIDQLDVIVVVGPDMIESVDCPIAIQIGDNLGQFRAQRDFQIRIKKHSACLTAF